MWTPETGMRSRRRLGRSATFFLLLIALGPAGVCAAAQGGDEFMSYREAKQFLDRHTQVIELINDQGARVAVCPQWQGRVMTSSCAGPEGASFGFINRAYIEQGKHDLHFANYGAEDRMWLSPEGGQFSLWFKHGDPQNLQHWFTAPALNEGAWSVVSGAGEPCLRMQRPMQLTNASRTTFTLDVTREVRLASAQDLAAWFGAKAAATLARPGNRLVSYETVNTITNRGAAMRRETGLLSIWMLGMLNAGPQTVVIVPYRPGDEATLGPVVKSDYFGPIPTDRLKILPQAVLFLADGNCRSKIGTSQRRARNVLGAIDFAGKTVSLVQFTMPDDPTRHAYMNNMWELPQKQPYMGDVANSYNDGPPEPGKKGMGAFYEIESLSPAVELKTGEALTHHHRTLHVQADLPVLAELVREVLGVDVQAVRRAMIR